MRQLTVYVRQGCHLCTDMAQALERLRPELDFDVTSVDIDIAPTVRHAGPGTGRRWCGNLLLLSRGAAPARAFAGGALIS